jgi:acyl transferase domain-containing protein
MTRTESPAGQYRVRLVDAERTIGRLQARLQASRDGWLSEPIALTGIGCRFPGGADDPESFWQLLRNGVDAITEFPPERADAAALYDPDPDAAGKTYTINGGFLTRIDQFEPEIFGISPREAVGMDPQHRILLEVAWEALERSGYAPDSLSGSRTGVFLGLSTTDYVRLRQQIGDIADVDAYQLIGEPSFLAGRLSHTLGLRGPSKVIDTACSSSLAAVHDACQALRSRECDLALAGGVNLILSPYGFVLMSKFRALSPDGRCKTFDASADGYGRGEGAGVVTLKRLDDAIADRDTVLAVIRGSASNHDGRSSGLTVPSPVAQQEVIRAALAQARIDPGLVDYVEAHGTGTSLGDPIELRVLQDVIGSQHAPGDPLLVGSVKTNIGHLEPASGIAGLIKAVLAMQHGEIPPHLHFSQPNPNVAWDRLNIEVTSTLRDWPRRDRPMVAAVSSFGASGTNAHAVITSPPSLPGRPEPADPGAPGLMVLSARTAEALTDLADRYARHLGRTEGLNFADACHTTQVGRARLAQGLAVVAASTDELIETLGGFARGSLDRRIVTATLPPYRQRKTAWLFTGQGAQYAGMAAGLRGEPVFDEALARAAALLDPDLGQPLHEVLWPGEGSTSPIDDTRYTQPALFALQYALAELWRSWGAQPAALAGHSIGEISAAVVAGVLSLEDGAALVLVRSRLMSELPPGGVMISVNCDETTALAAVAPYASTVSIAAVNGPAATVLSGLARDVEAAVAELVLGGAKATKLTVSHAFHSSQMQPMVEEFAGLLSGMAFRAPDIPLISNLSGQLWTDDDVGPGYWSRHVIGTVRFADGMRTLSDQGIRTFLEIGPAPVLCALGGRCLEDPEAVFIPSLHRRGANRTVLLRALGTLHLHGTNVDWAAVHRGRELRRVPLPTTPWRGTSYWFREADQTAGQAVVATAGDASAQPVFPADGGLGSIARRLRSAIPTYEISLDPEHVEWVLQDTAGRRHVPLGILVDLMVAAAHDSLGGQWNMIEEVVLHEPFYTSDSEPRTVHLTIIYHADEGQALCEYHSISAIEATAGAPWTLHARGVLGRRARAPQLTDAPGSPIDTTMYGHVLRVEPGAVPAALAGALDRVGQGEDGVLLALNEDSSVGWAVLIDAAVASVRWAAHPGALGPRPSAVAMRISEMSCTDPERVRYVRGITGRAGAHDADGVAEFFTEAGEPLGGIRQLHVMDPASAPARAAPWRDVGQLMYDLGWQPLDGRAELVGQGEDRVGQGWLLITDRQGVAERCAEALRQAGAQVVMVPPQVTGTAWDCVPDLAAVRGAVADWRSAADRPERVVLFTGLDAPLLDHADASSLEESVARADLMAAALVRELHEQLPGARLCLVTRGAVGTSADEAVINPAAGTLWGLGRVIALEHPEQWGGAVDLDPAGWPDEASLLLAAWARCGAEDQQALRGGGTLVARLAKRPLRHGELAREAVVRADGTYLITGAFGGIGKALGQWLTRSGAGRLVLLARTELPDRRSWEEDLPAQVRANVDFVQALERQGVEVEAVACDVADETQMAEALAAIEKHPFPLRGVIHAAGLSHPQLVREIEPADFRKVWRPKVVGGWLIHQLTQTADLDFFLCFSSIAATWGSQHLASYASGNAFLDGLAQHRHAAGLSALTVSWGPWDLPSSLYGTEVMAFLESTGLHPLSTPQSVRLLSAMLADECPVRVVCAADWARYKGVMEARIERPVLRTIEVSDDSAEAGGPECFYLRV